MAGGRFDLRPILRGHWRGLTDGRSRKDAPDWPSRAILLSALTLVPVSYTFDWCLAAPGPLLAGVALLAGALVGSFGTMTTLRLKLVDLADIDDEALAPERDLLDESVSHLLLAAFIAATDAVVLAIGTNTAGATGAVTGLWAALAIGLSAYLFLIFVMILPRLYAAYVQINDVRPGLNGQHRRRRTLL
jgi:hypothetical protein